MCYCSFFFFFLFIIFISLDNIFPFSYLKTAICANVVILVLD